MALAGGIHAPPGTCSSSFCCCLFVPLFFIFLSLQFSNIKIFHHSFHRNCENVEFWYTCGQWADVSCILESSCCCLFISLFFSFFFLSNFQTLKFFIILFSGTVRPRRLKLGTHVDSAQMYRVYRNQAAAAYLSLCFSVFFLSNFQTLKMFVTLFSGTARPRLKLGTHVDRCIVYTGIRLLLHISLFISSFFFLPNFLTLNFFCQFFLRNCEAQKVETWYKRGQWADVLCTLESGCCSFFVPLFFIFLSLQF